jgi:hyperosmotically inducible protein
MRWPELETRITLMRFTMPRLFNIAHFQNQRKTAVLCMNALQTRAAGRQVNGWKVFCPLWTLADVSVSQDRDKGVVTLGGHVPSDSDRAQAESIAKSIAGGQVVSNQIGVIPPAAESEAKTVNSDLDKGIEKNLDAALIQRRLHKGVKYDVKNGVVTLTGEVNSQARRAQVEKVASAVPNVQQVVNEIQVKDQKATSSH